MRKTAVAPHADCRRLLPVIQEKIVDGSLFHGALYSRAELSQVVQAGIEALEEVTRLTSVRPRSAWTASDGPVLGWPLPVSAPPYVGTPHEAAWPDTHTHWTPLPRPTL